MQFPKELQPGTTVSEGDDELSLNEVQFPKELQLSGVFLLRSSGSASMKCSSRRNCNRRLYTMVAVLIRLNEVQFPKELQHLQAAWVWVTGTASMKCSSRRNCNSPRSLAYDAAGERTDCDRSAMRSSGRASARPHHLRESA